jgi:hypothetical protein
MHDPKLQEMIAKACDAWPEIIYRGKRDSRAHKAAALVERGRVHHLNGSRYDVDGKRCDADLDICQCADHEHGAPWYPKVGKLCKHRLAARMYRAWQGDRNDKLGDFLTKFLSTGGATLIVEWDYQTDRRQIVGYIYNRSRNRWPGNQGIEFTWQQLRMELGAIDWGLMELPTKGSGNSYEYFYPIAPGRGIEINEHTMATYGINQVMVDRNLDRRLTRQFAGQMAAAA